MLRYALLFFVLAIAMMALGFSGQISGILLWGCQILVVLFVVLAIVSAITGKSPPLE